MNDPLSPLTAPPPRYLIESDSSDEEGQGAYPGSATAASSSRRAVSQPQIRVETPSGTLAVDEVVLGLGQAGRYIARKLSGGQDILKVSVDGRVVGRGLQAGKGLVVLVDEGDIPNDALWSLVHKVLEAIRAESWLIVTAYVPSMYIPSTAEHKSGKLKGDAPIRVFSSSSSQAAQSALPTDVAKWDSPNYLTGIAAALTSSAAHPSSSFSSPPTTLLLPLPLSALSPNLTLLLQALSPSLSTCLTNRAEWTEDDDEPYTAPGMGKVRGIRKGVGEAAGMYT